MNDTFLEKSPCTENSSLFLLTEKVNMISEYELSFGQLFLLSERWINCNSKIALDIIVLMCYNDKGKLSVKKIYKKYSKNTVFE